MHTHCCSCKTAFAEPSDIYECDACFLALLDDMPDGPPVGPQAWSAFEEPSAWEHYPFAPESFSL